MARPRPLIPATRRRRRPAWQTVRVGRVGPRAGRPGGRTGRGGRGAVVLLGLVLLLALGSSRAGAAGLGERVLDFTSDAEVEADGSLLVHETIAYQFSEPRHGIIRSIVTRQRYDSSRKRVFPLEVLSVQ